MKEILKNVIEIPEISREMQTEIRRFEEENIGLVGKQNMLKDSAKNEKILSKIALNNELVCLIKTGKIKTPEELVEKRIKLLSAKAKMNYLYNLKKNKISTQLAVMILKYF